MDHQELWEVSLEEQVFNERRDVSIPCHCPAGMVIVQSMEKIDDGKSPIGFLVVGWGEEDTVLSLPSQFGGGKLVKFYS
jgi:hypothetical protein